MNLAQFAQEVAICKDAESMAGHFCESIINPNQNATCLIGVDGRFNFEEWIKWAASVRFEGIIVMNLTHSKRIEIFIKPKKLI